MRDGWKQFPLGEIVELGKGGSWGQDDPSVGLIQAVCLRGTDLADLIDGKIPNAPVRWIKESELRKLQEWGGGGGGGDTGYDSALSMDR